MKTIQKILIASGNIHKISEIKSVLKKSPNILILSLKDFGIKIVVKEDGKTLQENALIKAKKTNSVLRMPTISDDTGLFVDALNGAPGIYSARYAGEIAGYKENRMKLLSEMRNVQRDKRSAHFKSVICFYVNDKEHYFFEGVCKGKIIYEEKGKNGFGYDSIFVPDGINKTFAEMTDSDKNKISHRANALEQFRKFSVSYFQ